VSGTARRGDGVLPLLAARSVALYALSLHAAASALMAWTAGDAGMVALAAAILALALIIGESFGGIVVAGLEGTSRLRLRFTVAAAYAGLVVLALTAAVGTGEARLLGQEALLFTVLQAAFLLLVDLGRTHLGPVANALVLVVLASLRGGVVAAVAVVGGLALLGFFLALDHAARMLQAYPAGRADLLGATLRRATASLAPLVFGLTILFVLSPPAPLARVRFLAAAPGPRDEEVAAAYRRLVVFGLAGSALIFVLVRLLRRERGARSPLEEALPLEHGIEEALPEPPPSFAATITAGAGGSCAFTWRCWRALATPGSGRGRARRRGTSRPISPHRPGRWAPSRSCSSARATGRTSRPRNRPWPPSARVGPSGPALAAKTACNLITSCQPSTSVTRPPPTPRPSPVS